jgi:hypothetical protein
LIAELAAVEKRVGVEIDTVVAAQTDADRAMAKGRLDVVRREKAQLEEAVAKAKATLRHRVSQAE